jgi:HNH endonuclease
MSAERYIYRAANLTRYAVTDRGYETPCHVWQGAHVGGYGRVRDAGRLRYAHVMAWEAVNGPVPAGLELDHLCRVPACIRPDHLEAVTRAVNVRRGDGPRLSRERKVTKTHCPQGHPYDAVNTYVDSNGWRHCRACTRDRRPR